MKQSFGNIVARYNRFSPTLKFSNSGRPSRNQLHRPVIDAGVESGEFQAVRGRHGANVAVGGLVVALYPVRHDIGRPGQSGQVANAVALVLGEAKRLSSAYTLAGGHRSLDLRHVSAAAHLTAGTFLSFDANQRTLAKAAGLRVRP
jgi:hypothetical protein